MNDLIDHNIKFIVQYGQYVISLIIGISLYLIYLIERKNRAFYPKRAFGFIGNAFLIILMTLSSLSFMVVTGMKADVMGIVEDLEQMKGKQAPDLKFQLVANDSIKNLEAYQGNIVLLNYWATWCPGCIKELDDLNKIQAVYAGKGVVVIAISDEEKEDIQKFTETRPIKVVSGYLELFDWVDLGSARPVTFILNQEGIVEDYFTGSYDYDFFETEITKYLNRQSPE